MMPAPESLGEFGTECWNTYAPLLIKEGVLTDLDWPAFHAMCEAYQEWHYYTKAMRDPDMGGGPVIQGKQKGSWQYNPLLHLANRGRKEYFRLCAEFGMTPSSRTKVRDASKVKPRNNAGGSVASRLRQG